MMALPDCPTLECWEALFDEAVPPEKRASFEGHLEACPACQARLDQAGDGGDVLLPLLRQVGDPRALPADPALQNVVERLRETTSAAVRPAPARSADLYFLRPADRPGLLGMLGGYEVQEVIGQGGMGVVLKAFEPALNRCVAIKVLAAVLAGSATARERFQREARAAAAVCHDHVVAVHGVSETDGLPYLVMQYVAGESLQDRIDRTGPLEVEEVVRIGYQTAAGLAAAHAQGLIHRDVKPANLLLENGVSRVKITDFGLARTADDVSLTRDGDVAGTPEYMAPEQARSEPIDYRADLFSLGSVLYACCTGVSPFGSGAPLAVLRRVSEEAPLPVRARRPDVPAWLEVFIARLLAKNPAERFSSAAEAAALLESYLAHLRQPATVAAPYLAPLLPTPAASGGKMPRQRRAWPVVFVVLVAGLVLGGARWFMQIAAPVEPPRAEPLEYYHDFRNRPLPPELTPFHPGDSPLLQVEPEGLRITLPRNPTEYPGEGVGVRTTFGFQGDFEATATVEVLHLEPPPSGYGAGVGMGIEAGPRRAYLHRFIFRNGQHVILYGRRYPDPVTNKPIWRQNGPPCSDTLLRLRLKRTGTTVSYWWAPGTTGDDFEEVPWSRSEVQFGTDPVQYLLLTVGNGRTDCPLDVRLIDLRIRSGLPAGAVPDGLEETPPKTAGMLWLVIALGIAVPAGVGMAVWQSRRRKRDTPASPPAADQAASSEADPAPLACACSGCGKRLRVRAALAGKKVKCPQCGQAILVPNAEGAEPDRTSS